MLRPHYLELFGFFLLFSLLHDASPSSRRCCIAADVDTLTAGQALAAGDKLVSRNGKFALGFFSLPSSTSGSSKSPMSSSSSLDNTTTTSSANWYLGIWFDKVPDFKPVWIANRDQPITHTAGLELKLSPDGNLVVVTGIDAETVVWSTEEIANNASSSKQPISSYNGTAIIDAVLTHNGNLVVRDSSSNHRRRVRWQSFDYPTDVFLPGSKLGRNKLTGLNRVFVSYKNRIDPARGSYCVGVDARFSQGIILSHCASSVVYWASGTFSQQNVDPSDSGLISYNHVDDDQEQYYTYSIPNDTLSIYTLVESSGQIKAHVWDEGRQRWRQFYTQPMDPCSVHAACGPFAICTNNNANLSCHCMRGFSVQSPGEWDLDDRAGGCTRKNQLDCTTDGFLPVPGVTLAYNPATMNVADADHCRQACATDCSCTAYSYTTSTSSGGCSIWRGELLNTVASTTAGQTLYLRLAAKDLPTTLLGEKRRASSAVVAASIAASGIVVLIILLFIIWRTYVLPSSSTQQDFAGIRTFRYSQLCNATKNFSERLGGGGFGSVYKGLLSDSSVAIAVKSLDGAHQGEKQFRAEVSSIGLIQHINLVKLIGFCCDSDKRLLVYEHMFHGSLDARLFDATDDTVVLDWSTRYQIATGVARGLSYLHEGCSKCIIHCDIKPENILLDASFVPKIADFGMAAIVGRDFSRVMTTFRGTVGYLAPEWISGEAITQKVDVYSFGMVLLEIVSGRRNSPKVYTTGSYHTSYFPMQAISMLHGGDVNSLVDPKLRGEFNLEEAIRLCKVAFWCIQDNEFDRPTIGEVVRALEGLHDFDMPPVPRQLAAITIGQL